MVSGGEIVFPEIKGLAEIRFSALLPQVVYPFAVYKSGFVLGGDILQGLLNLQESGKPFRFIVFRKSSGGKPLASTNIKTVFSEIRSREDATEGRDIYIDVRLSEYRDFAVKNVSVNPLGDVKVPPPRRPADNIPVVNRYYVNRYDTLWMIAHKLLGDGSRYKEIYNLNKNLIDNKNEGNGTSTYTIFPEQNLIIPKR